MKQETQSRHIPFYPFVWLAFKCWGLFAKLNYDRVAPINHIQRIKGKVFLIHGEEDKIVPITQAEDLYQAANGDRVKYWAISGFGHNDYYQHEQFWENVVNFLQETMGLPVSDQQK